MNKSYEVYVIDKWKEAEEIARKVGSITNHTVATIFDKLCQPYYYWSKNGGK